MILARGSALSTSRRTCRHAAFSTSSKITISNSVWTLKKQQQTLLLRLQARKKNPTGFSLDRQIRSVPARKSSDAWLRDDFLYSCFFLFPFVYLLIIWALELWVCLKSFRLSFGGKMGMKSKFLPLWCIINKNMINAFSK